MNMGFNSPSNVLQYLHAHLLFPAMRICRFLPGRSRHLNCPKMRWNHYANDLHLATHDAPDLQAACAEMGFGDGNYRNFGKCDVQCFRLPILLLVWECD